MGTYPLGYLKGLSGMLPDRTVGAWKSIGQLTWVHAAPGTFVGTAGQTSETAGEEYVRGLPTLRYNAPDGNTLLWYPWYVGNGDVGGDPVKLLYASMAYPFVGAVPGTAPAPIGPALPMAPQGLPPGAYAAQPSPWAFLSGLFPGAAPAAPQTPPSPYAAPPPFLPGSVTTKFPR